jgi:hypothetical protein
LPKRPALSILALGTAAGDIERDQERAPDPALLRYFFTQVTTAFVSSGPSQLAPLVPLMCSVLPSTLQYALIMTSSASHAAFS